MRKKTEGSKPLPRGLRVRNGYYSYRSPIDGKEIGLGRDRKEAFQYAVTNNMALAAVRNRYTGSALILSAVDIAEAATTVNALCGVYFLLAGPQIIYVGKSTNVHWRIADHYAKKVIPFNRFHIVPCEERDVDHLEALYINALRPKYNADLRSAKALDGAVRTANGKLYSGEQWDRMGETSISPGENA